MSIWWVVALALGALAAAVAGLGATRLRREGGEVRASSEAIRALTGTVIAARSATGRPPAVRDPRPALPPGPVLPPDSRR